MVNHYAERFQWIFKYTSKNLGYCILKTLCIIVGLPIYLVCFVAEMALTLVNLLFSFVPGLGLVVMLVCKMLMWIIDKPYYICVSTPPSMPILPTLPQHLNKLMMSITQQKRTHKTNQTKSRLYQSAYFLFVYNLHSNAVAQIYRNSVGTFQQHFVSK